LVKLFYKDKTANILGFRDHMDHMISSQLLKAAIVVQSYTAGKQKMGMCHVPIKLCVKTGGKLDLAHVVHPTPQPACKPLLFEVSSVFQQRQQQQQWLGTCWKCRISDST
jgi:hypothetical protein